MYAAESQHAIPPPGILIAVVVVDVGVIVVVTADRRLRFLLASGRGGRTVALAPNPPVSPPVVGPRGHLPPQRQSRPGSSAMTMIDGGVGGGREVEKRTPDPPPNTR